eukprot:403330908
METIEELKQSFKEFNLLEQKFEDKVEESSRGPGKNETRKFSINEIEKIVDRKPSIKIHQSETSIPKLLPLPIFQGQMSLKDDIKLGWRPIQPIASEVPTNFRIEEFELTQKERSSGHLIYKYPKIKNSKQLLDLHQNKKPFQSKFNFDVKPPQNGASFSLQALDFTCEFESGNLDKVIRVGDKEYNIYMRPDSNTKGCFQWFNFVVKNVFKVKGVQFNIMNFKKKSVLYQTSEEYIKNKHPWIEGGYDIKIMRDDLYKYNYYDYYQYKKPFYTLSFKFDFEHQLNLTQFSLGIPYTYTDLQDFLRPLKHQNLQYLKIEKLCTQLSGIKVPVLTVTEPQVNDSKKKLIIISARIHPGDHQSSYVMEGILNFLTSQKGYEEYLEQVQELRENFIFKIVPMLNCEGVIIGNNRTSLAGNDLERYFEEPDQYTHPEMYNLRSLICHMIDDKKVKPFLYLNLMSNMNKKNFFLNSNYFSLHDKNYPKIRCLPQILHNMSSLENDCQFRYHSCKFKNPQNRPNCPRVQLFKEFGFLFSYDFISSMYGYRGNKRENFSFKIDDFLNMGKILMRCVYELSSLENEVKKKKGQKGTIYDQLQSRLMLRDPKREKITKEIIKEIEDFDEENSRNPEPRYSSMAVVSKVKIFKNKTLKKKKQLNKSLQPLSASQNTSQILDQTISTVSEKHSIQRELSKQHIEEIKEDVNLYEKKLEEEQSFRIDELDGIQLLKLKRVLIAKGVQNSPEKELVLQFIDNQILKLRKEYSKSINSQGSPEPAKSILHSKRSHKQSHYHKHCMYREDELAVKLEKPSRISPHIKLVEKLQEKLQSSTSKGQLLSPNILQQKSRVINLSLSQSFSSKNPRENKTPLIPTATFLDEQSQDAIQIKEENQTPTPDLLNPMYNEKPPRSLNQSAHIQYDYNDDALILQQMFQELQSPPKPLEFPFTLPRQKDLLKKSAVQESLKLQEMFAKLQTQNMILSKMRSSTPNGTLPLLETSINISKIKSIQNNNTAIIKVRKAKNLNPSHKVQQYNQREITITQIDQLQEQIATAQTSQVKDSFLQNQQNLSEYEFIKSPNLIDIKASKNPSYLSQLANLSNLENLEQQVFETFIPQVKTESLKFRKNERTRTINCDVSLHKLYLALNFNSQQQIYEEQVIKLIYILKHPSTIKLEEEKGTFKRYVSLEGFQTNQETKRSSFEIPIENDIAKNVVIGNRVKVRIPASLKDKNQSAVHTKNQASDQTENLQELHIEIDNQAQPLDKQQQTDDILPKVIQQTPYENLNKLDEKSQEFKYQLQLKLSELYQNQLEQLNLNQDLSELNNDTSIFQNSQNQLRYKNQQVMIQKDFKEGPLNIHDYNQEDQSPNKSNVLQKFANRLSNNSYQSQQGQFNNTKSKSDVGTSFQQYLKKKKDIKVLMWYNKQLKFQLPSKPQLL